MAVVRSRKYLVIIEYVLVTFESTDENEVHGLEVINDIEEGYIESAKWTKPAGRRLSRFYTNNSTPNCNIHMPSDCQQGLPFSHTVTV